MAPIAERVEMTVKLEGCKKPYHPKDSDPVECHVHGVKTTWGALDAIQRLAVEEGLDTSDDLPCLLAPREVHP
jgi:hypothetical protein